MKKILPNFNEPLLITITKIGALIATVIGFIALAIFLPAGGHPPGIVFVPIVLGVWATVMVALTLTFYSLKLIANTRSITSAEHFPYSFSIIISSVYFLYLLLDSVCRMMPYALYAAVPGVTIEKIITLLIAYLVLASTILQKKWARHLTIIILLLPIIPIILFLYSLIVVGESIGGLGFAQVKFLIITFISIWVIYEYLSNEKVKLYFSR